MSESGRSVLANGALLASFALAMALLVAMTQLGTAERIDAARRQARTEALQEIVPPSRYDNNLLEDTLPAPVNDPLLQLPMARSIHRARLDGDVTTVIIPARAPDGYGGAIDLLVGVSRDGCIAALRVVQHTETPGLGDKVEARKSDWVRQFRGRSLSDPSPPRWAVRKDGGVFDQLTGATITPRAIVEATKRTLEFVDRERSWLFSGETVAMEARG